MEERKRRVQHAILLSKIFNSTTTRDGDIAAMLLDFHYSLCAYSFFFFFFFALGLIERTPRKRFVSFLYFPV